MLVLGDEAECKCILKPVLLPARKHLSLIWRGYLFFFLHSYGDSWQVNRARTMGQVGGGVNLPSRQQRCFTAVVVTLLVFLVCLVFLIIINFLFLNQLFRTSLHRCAGEWGRKQPWGTLFYVVVPELSKHQVGGTDLSPLWPWSPQCWSQKRTSSNL